MAPQRARKRKSAASTATDASEAPAVKAHVASKIVPTKVDSSAGISKTPTRSPMKQRRPLLTVAQKQALIENLQLEVTERARKLRAQYALQAQGLRTRLEIRVHRIPAALRKAKLSDLIEKYARGVDAPKASANASENIDLDATSETIIQDAQIHEDSRTKARGVKRPSEDANTTEVDTKMTTNASNKRVRTTEASEQHTSTTAASRDASRRAPPSQVLSPKSHNSRIVPRSPVKGAYIPSPAKSQIARPTSPLKVTASSQAMAPAAAKTTDKPRSKPLARTASKQGNSVTAKAGTTRTKRAAAAAAAAAMADDDTENRASNMSDAASSSAGTTIVTKPKPSQTTGGTTAARGRKNETVTKSTASTARGKAVVPPKAAESTGGTLRGGRTLRKRA